MNRLIKTSLNTSGKFTGKIIVFLFFTFFLPFLYIAFGFKKSMMQIITEFRALPEHEKNYICLKGFCFFVGISIITIIVFFLFFLVLSIDLGYV